MKEVSGIDLISAVENNIQSIRTRSLDLSFNELLDMYMDEELIINPEYQRLFRWSEGKQSRFMESLLLELPVPPIFVIELEEGVYELIDGLQRISSYLNFRGKLKEKDPLTLVDCDIVTELNGLMYNNLPKPLEIKLKRNFIRVEILRKESDPRLRYYMFKRLNTGGEILSDQELRNSTIRLMDGKFNDILKEFSENSHFKKTIDNISSRKVNEKYDQELVLRYLAFKNNIDSYIHDVGDFLTEYMEIATLQVKNNEFDIESEKYQFEKTFEIISKTMDSKGFSGLSIKGELSNSFLIYHYEAFVLGTVKVIDLINPNDTQEMSELKNTYISIKKDQEFKKMTTGGGKNTRKQLIERINFVEKGVKEKYEQN